MGIPNTTRQASANAVAALGNWISVHTGAGAGTNGDNETSGSGYSRRQTGWTPTGTGGNTGSVVNIPVGPGTFTEGGIWSAQTGGAFVGSDSFTGGDIIVSGGGASIDITPAIAA